MPRRDSEHRARVPQVVPVQIFAPDDGASLAEASEIRTFRRRGSIRHRENSSASAWLRHVLSHVRREGVHDERGRCTTRRLLSVLVIAESDRWPGHLLERALDAYRARVEIDMTASEREQLAVAQGQTMRQRYGGGIAGRHECGELRDLGGRGGAPLAVGNLPRTLIWHGLAVSSPSVTRLSGSRAVRDTPAQARRPGLIERHDRAQVRALRLRAPRPRATSALTAVGFFPVAATCIPCSTRPDAGGMLVRSDRGELARGASRAVLDDCRIPGAYGQRE